MGRQRLSLILAISVIFIGSLLLSCGEDGKDGENGKDGKAFLALDWTYAPIYFSTNAPGFPYIIYPGQYYGTSPGSYSFYYTAWDGTSYTGSVRIFIEKGTPGEKGEEGGLFWWQDGKDGADGADGKNKYFKIWLFSTGPSLSTAGMNDEQTRGIAAGLGFVNSPEIVNAEWREGLAPKSPDSDIKTIEKKQGIYNIRIEFQKIGNMSE